MIEINDLLFQYDNADFRLSVGELSIERGTRTAIFGPSGSGKTTLLYLIAGILVPQRGNVRVADVDLSGLGDAARRNFRISRIGLVFQDFELVEYLSVRENILFSFLINGSLKLDTAVREQARRLADSMGMGDKLNRPVGRLSHGEKQRVAICRALLPGPKVLLADEPTGNLDPENRRRIVQILFDRAARTEATLIVVTHDHGILQDFDRVIDFQDFTNLSNIPGGD